MNKVTEQRYSQSMKPKTSRNKMTNVSQIQLGKSGRSSFNNLTKVITRHSTPSTIKTNQVNPYRRVVIDGSKIENNSNHKSLTLIFEENPIQITDFTLKEAENEKKHLKKLIKKSTTAVNFNDLYE